MSLDYHRSKHDGLVLPAAPDLHLTPLEMFDALIQVTGRLHVTQRPDLLYDFLPVRWGTVGHAGVEFSNLTYDCEQLDPFRNAKRGTYRSDDRAMPFLYDPHDVSRVWFRHPESRLIVEVPWRGAHMIDAPMTEAVLGHVRSQLAGRGRRHRGRDDAERQIIEELGSLDRGLAPADWNKRLAAADRRAEASQADHGEAAAVSQLAELIATPGLDARDGLSSSGVLDGPSIYDDEWPDLRAR